MNIEPDPTRTDSRCVLPVGNGHLVLSGWPGLRITPAGDAWIDPEATATTLADFHERYVTVLVGLCEPTDLPPEAIAQLRDWARQRSLRLVHAPIRDYHPPDDRFLRRWRSLSDCLHGQVETGAAVALACSYGVRIPTHPVGCSDNIRSVIPGYPFT